MGVWPQASGKLRLELRWTSYQRRKGGRFAVKEAVFKALAHPSGEYLEFYEIETLSYDDGAPYVTKTPAVERALEKAGASELLVSITNEGNYAVAIVLAQ